MISKTELQQQAVGVLGSRFRMNDDLRALSQDHRQEPSTCAIAKLLRDQDISLPQGPSMLTSLCGLPC